LINFKNRPPFKLDVKKLLAQQYAKTVDVLFLQEAGTVQWSEL